MKKTKTNNYISDEVKDMTEWQTEIRQKDKNIDPKIYIQNISVAFDEQIIQT